jgi:hypothetical protein
MSLIDIVNNISSERERLTKTETNLPARLMAMHVKPTDRKSVV